MGVKIGDIVTLHAFEQAICESIAESRHDNNRQSGVTDKKMGDQSATETDLYGIAAEFAFCKLFNLFPDFSIEPRSAAAGTDVEKDSKLFIWRVDVKGTKYPFGKLLARPMDKNYATHVARSTTDLFALMTGEYPTFTFRGFFTKEDLLKQSRIGDLGHGPTYIAQQHELYNAHIQCPGCEKLAPLTDFPVVYVSSIEENLIATADKVMDKTHGRPRPVLQQSV